MLVRRLLCENAVHHGDEQRPYHPRRGATGPSGDGVRRPATKGVVEILRLDRPPEGGRQSGTGVALGLTPDHSVLHVILRAGVVPARTVAGPAYPR